MADIAYYGLEVDSLRESVRLQLAKQLGQAPPAVLVEHVLKTYVGQVVQRAISEHLSRDEVHAFWRKPDLFGNNPEDYLYAPPDRSQFLLELIKPLELTAPSILEIGCNAGRNLNALWQAGYHNLRGFDLNADALELLRAEFPAMAAEIVLEAGPAEEVLPSIQNRSIDLVFSMAVLVHIHYESNWVLEDVARIARRHIVTIEDEACTTSRHFKRNYRDVFEGLGFCQIAEHGMEHIQDLTQYTARVFERI
jgi:SAM-dependent methyltransferase